MDIDLNAIRAARLEAGGDNHTITFGKAKLKIPAEIPFAYVEVASSETPTSTEMLKAFLGNKQYKTFLEQEPSNEDVNQFFGAIMKLYGMSPGESPASESSSTKTSRPSKQTSNASTVST